ncbi:MAG: Stk1 family PASTA domain-containing Ser/Thr kinase [Clostridiales bacterium]|jgi:serine/threonine-protein kinase|nr:Stk1 family PASTA domain-containing Ser/Thr kinase [Clostridiales bacterium]
MEKYIGKLLDNRYEILEVIGSGGMAVVYKARCHRLNRLVAVKILKDEFSQDADFRNRFHAESQAVAMLSHPNIVSVYDVSKSSETEYIVMELIDGMSLKEYMQKKGSLTWREALHFITQIMKALEHAHSRGIIHRDIKPHNVMVMRDGSVRVTDFGIAHLASKQNTLTQEALGSVHYISPEQAKGGKVDFRTDIYSAGVVLYEMLTGRLPFDGDSPVAVAIQHINSIPLRPREINPEIPEGLEEITLKAMCADINKRYPTATAMLDNLEEFRKDPQISFNYDMDLGTAGFSDNNAKSRTGLLNRGERFFEKKEKFKREEKIRDQSKRAGRVSILAGVAAVLAFILALTYFLWTFFFQDLFVAAPEITVPDLVGKMLDDVINNEKYKDFEIIQGKTQESDVYVEGTILEQVPLYGALVKKGATITVTVSSGSTVISMPDLVGKSWRQAQEDLKSALDGSILYSIETFYMISENETEGNVISTEPESGARLRNGANITVIISRGANITLVEVPDVVGMMQSQAVSALTERGLIVGTVTEVENDEEAGRVVFQSYAPGSEVEKGIVVDIRVSLGPPATPPPTQPPVTAPTETEDPEGSGAGNSVTVTIPLPNGSGPVYVEVWQEDTRIVAETFDKSRGAISVVVTGTGQQWLYTYCDGVKTYTTLVDFDNG